MFHLCTAVICMIGGPQQSFDWISLLQKLVAIRAPLVFKADWFVWRQRQHILWLFVTPEYVRKDGQNPVAMATEKKCLQQSSIILVCIQQLRLIPAYELMVTRRPLMGFFYFSRCRSGHSPLLPGKGTTAAGKLFVQSRKLRQTLLACSFLPLVWR